MIQERILRKLMVTGITVATLAASLSLRLAGAQPAGNSEPKAQPAPAGESMKQMPGAREKRVVTVIGNEDWDSLRGFGKDSGMVAMMTLMMVGGSGMEHMKMAPMKKGGMPMAGMSTGETSMSAPAAMNPSNGMPLTVTVTPNPPIVGDNTLDIAVTDASGKPVAGLKLAASVAMTSMDMGTERPKVVEGRAGHYSTVVNFSMKGPWRVMLTGGAPRAEKPDAVRTALDFDVGSDQRWGQPAVPRVALLTPTNNLKIGRNALEFTLRDGAGKPLTGAKVVAAVAMTSMDMGTSHPNARAGKDGHYTLEAAFSMKGPWRVTLTVTSPGQKPFAQSFDVNVTR